MVEDDQVPLNGYGDGHEDAAGKKDIVKGVEEVGEEMVMVLGDKAKNISSICHSFFKRPPYTLRNTE